MAQITEQKNRDKTIRLSAITAQFFSNLKSKQDRLKKTNPSKTDLANVFNLEIKNFVSELYKHDYFIHRTRPSGEQIQMYVAAQGDVDNFILVTFNGVLNTQSNRTTYASVESLTRHLQNGQPIINKVEIDVVGNLEETKGMKRLPNGTREKIHYYSQLQQNR